MKVCFLIRSLGVGGAERQLVLLMNGLAERGWGVSVAVLYPGGSLEAELSSRVCIESIGKRHRWEVGRVLLRIWRWLRRERPDILHSYLSVPNILGSLFGAVVPSLKIVWGVRASKLPLDMYDWLMVATERASVLFARGAQLIIANSEAGRRYCISAGYPSERLIVIPNGIDTWRFAPSLDARAKLRATWGAGAHEKLIGLVGRLDPVKGHELFIRAASSFSKRQRDIRYVFIGDGPEAKRAELQQFARDNGLAEHILWLPASLNMPAVYNALDIVCSASFSEGFPNVLGEAMACGVPCVATRVGDSECVVGNTGEIVPPGDSAALCLAWERMLARIASDGERSGLLCRERIVAFYARERLVDRTAEALQRLLNK